MTELPYSSEPRPGIPTSWPGRQRVWRSRSSERQEPPARGPSPSSRIRDQSRRGVALGRRGSDRRGRPGRGWQGSVSRSNTSTIFPTDASLAWRTPSPRRAIGASPWWLTIVEMSPTVVLDRLRFPESTRWRDGRLWLCNWLASEVLAVDPADGNAEVMATAPVPIPFCIDWLPEGRLLVTCGVERRLVAQAPDGVLQPYTDLTSVVARGAINEIVIDGRGNSFVNGSGYDMMAGEDPAPGPIVCVTPDGMGRTVAEDIHFGNGMAITADDSTLIVAESHAARLTAFSMAPTGRSATAVMGRPRRRCGARRDLPRRRRGGLVRRRPEQALRARRRGRRGAGCRPGRPWLLCLHARRRQRIDAVHRRGRVGGRRWDGVAREDRPAVAAQAPAPTPASLAPVPSPREARGRDRRPMLKAEPSAGSLDLDTVSATKLAIMLISEFARLGQVSVRMLRHCDAIGLLSPNRFESGSGYRSYSPDQLHVLNRIVALKELGFTLDQVGACCTMTLMSASCAGCCACGEPNWRTKRERSK